MKDTEATFDASMEAELKEAERYYRIGREPIDRIIGDKLVGSDLIVHGGRALNAQLPDWLDKATEDWDIISTAPKKTAKKLEHLLDVHYSGDFFKVAPAKHEGTFRIISNVTLEGIADISFPEKKIDYIILDGTRYATLEHHVERIKITLADPTKKFRWKRDEETLQRIRIYRRLHPKKAKPEVVPSVIAPITGEFGGF